MKNNTILLHDKQVKLYLAGKISKNDWRHDLIPNLRGHLLAAGPIVTPTYEYFGPFFVACDHSCTHGPNRHGSISDGSGGCESDTSAQEVIRNNKAAIETADLVFAYITANDCQGTLFEIGYASALGKRIIVAFAPEIDSADFWFSALQCHAVYHSVRPCCLQTIFADEIRKATAPVRRRRAPC